MKRRPIVTNRLSFKGKVGILLIAILTLILLSYDANSTRKYASKLRLAGNGYELLTHNNCFLHYRSDSVLLGTIMKELFTTFNDISFVLPRAEEDKKVLQFCIDNGRLYSYLPYFTSKIPVSYENHPAFFIEKSCFDSLKHMLTYKGKGKTLNFWVVQGSSLKNSFNRLHAFAYADNLILIPQRLVGN